MSWWPVADGGPWLWRPEAYPGVWLMLTALIAMRVLAVRARRLQHTTPLEEIDFRRRTRLFLAGLVTLWLAIDWPLGGLAAGRLLSAAALQYLLITLAAAPLLLLGFPSTSPSASRPSRSLAGLSPPPAPLLGGIAFAAVLFITAVPGIVDAFRPRALGSMALTLAWVGAALGLWWPLLRPRGKPLTYLAGIAYLFVPFILPKAPGLAYAITDHAIYEVYAGASRVPGLAMSAAVDQRLAGVLLWSAGTVMIFVSLGVLFFHWQRDERRIARPGTLELPANPAIVEELFTIPGAWGALENAIAHLDAALPADRGGVELRLSLRESEGRRVVAVELHVVLDLVSSRALAEDLERNLERYVRRMAAPRREAIREHLVFEVVPIHSRSL